MDTKSSISSQEWHIPRPSLSGSSTSGSISDTRSRGGSASSQGSSSNHSTHSVSSGSLLLSAAHLARYAKSPVPEEPGGGYQNKIASNTRKPFSESVVAIPEESRDPADSFWNGVKRGSAQGQDAASVASSTHFTVVNGFTKQRPGKEPKACCCDHSHQITVLVISMTILFSACILAAICFVEMRMRRETGIYKYS
ncbi:uncharacterized protein LOC113236517 [Hyposmocoma kahamanoa]|uniref:uncharacterized protein LOC113236517 n=1 Tax=Hyposmocoma kahamanoa TaxID=1477025 RepID=UPI000E6D875F|nr:uncharacterized protein LOC113236517 [Hyposmocoma kahamanoa]XP_026328411.1 uncharacterized protein LOC113236517 [Hyposmocoma kahamanoa]